MMLSERVGGVGCTFYFTQKQMTAQFTHASVMKKLQLLNWLQISHTPFVTMKAVPLSDAASNHRKFLVVTTEKPNMQEVQPTAEHIVSLQTIDVHIFNVQIQKSVVISHPAQPNPLFFKSKSTPQHRFISFRSCKEF